VSNDNADLLRILNQALSAEYGTLYLLPRHMAEIEDEEIKRQLHLIGEVELEHAEKTAQMIVSLGGEPTDDLINLRPRKDLKEILEVHLQGEREAIDIYGRALAVCGDPDICKQIEAIRREEEGHQRLIQRTLDRVTSSQA